MFVKAAKVVLRFGRLPFLLKKQLSYNVDDTVSLQHLYEHPVENVKQELQETVIYS